MGAWNLKFFSDVHYSPQGGAVSAGKALLQNFLQGVDSEVTIAGSQSSTKVESLQDSMSHIRLSTVKIPALNQNLIKSTSLTFPVDIIRTGMASASFILDNPFTASIDLLRTTAIATYQGLTLGEILNFDTSEKPIHAEGHSSVTSPELPLKLNRDPVTIIQLLLLSAKANGVDLGPLYPFFQFITQNPDFKPSVRSFGNPYSLIFIAMLRSWRPSTKELWVASGKFCMKEILIHTLTWCGQWTRIWRIGSNPQVPCQPQGRPVHRFIG